LPEHLELLGVDKHGEPWFVEVSPYDDELSGATFHAWPESLPPDDHPRYLAMAAVTLRHPLSRQELLRAKIEDIRIEDNRLENRGVGTLLLRCLEAWCRDRGFRETWGELSNIDSDHLDKLRHLYTKNGYTFSLFSAPRGIFIGEISKAL
jgi:GNAT superfamily N-acetyltransferase